MKVALWFGCLWLCIVPVFGASAQAQERSVSLQTWKTMGHLFDINFRLTRVMLLREMGRPLSSPDEQLRIQKNAASLGRIASAYVYYLGGLEQHFAEQKELWATLRKLNRKLGKISAKAREDSLQGEWSSGKRKELAGVSIPKKLFEKQVPKSFTKAQMKFLLDAISGIGTGAELLGYFRFRQLVGLFQTANAKQKNQVLKQFQQWSAQTKRYRDQFRALKKAFPKESWLPLFVYHASLLVRCGALFAQMQSKTGKPAEALKVRLKKRFEQLTKSLRKANPSFKDVWQPATKESL